MRILLFACTLTLAVAGVVQDGRTAVQMASDHETVAYLNLCLAVLLLPPFFSLPNALHTRMLD